jgi:hypothetical protein
MVEVYYNQSDNQDDLSGQNGSARNAGEGGKEGMPL